MLVAAILAAVACVAAALIWQMCVTAAAKRLWWTQFTWAVDQPLSTDDRNRRLGRDMLTHLSTTARTSGDRDLASTVIERTGPNR